MFGEALGYLLATSIGLGTGIFVYYMIWAELTAISFVPSESKKVIEVIKAYVSNKSRFLDIGSGDGRVVVEVAKKYDIPGTGIEINPILGLIGKIMAKARGVKNVTLVTGNMWEQNYRVGNLIYVYLVTGIVEKVSVKIEQECEKGTVIVSKVFAIKRWKNKLVKSVCVDGKDYYVYRI
jgi:16S rRNA A1518/A1519 N6-dimethyltransferase RsmA/KsgA/DIM1 with predicted DNA glycosylase/AP lyase activity